MKGFVRVLLASLLLAAGLHAVPVDSMRAHDAHAGMTECGEEGCPPDPQACAVHCLVQETASEPAVSPAAPSESTAASPDAQVSAATDGTEGFIPAGTGPPDPATDILLTIQKRE